MSDRVLVTGATGFIGHHLVETLVENGDNVACLVRATSDTFGLPVEQLELRLGDVTDPGSLESAVEDVEVIYHVAGALEARSLSELNLVNEAGARNMAAACGNLERPPVLVLLSSIEAVGPDPPDRLRTENDPADPVSNYGKSKLAGEQAVRELAGQVPTTIVRASGVFGPGDKETFAILQTLRVPGLDIFTVPRAHSTKVSVIHARDLADLMVRAAQRGERIEHESQSSEGIGQGIYYAADEEQLTLGELFGRVAEAMSEKEATIINLPIGFAWIAAGARVGWARLRGRSPGVVNIDKIRSFAAGSYTCSSEKAFQQLGFKPAHSLSERIHQTVDWYQAQGWI